MSSLNRDEKLVSPGQAVLASGTVSKGMTRRFDLDSLSYKTILTLLAAVVVILNLVPLYQIITNTFKSIDEFNGAGIYEAQGPNPFMPPKDWTLSTLDYFFTETTAPRALFNNIVISAVSIFLLVILGSVTALILTQYQTRFTTYIFNFMMGGHAIPRVMTIITIFLVTRAINALDTFHGMILVIAAQWLPFTIFLFYGYYKEFSRDLLDAAEIDGASFFQTAFRIVLPVSGPIIATIVILIFMSVWAIYLQSLILLRKEEMYILSQIIQNMEPTLRYKQPVFYAGFLVMALPMLAIAWWAQRYIASGMMAGAVKE